MIINHTKEREVNKKALRKVASKATWQKKFAWLPTRLVLTNNDVVDVWWVSYWQLFTLITNDNPYKDDVVRMHYTLDDPAKFDWNEPIQPVEKPKPTKRTLDPNWDPVDWYIDGAARGRTDIGL